MSTITFSAFSFLRPKLAGRGVCCSGATLEMPEGITVGELAARLGLEEGDVEAAFINGRITSVDSALHDGDRVALVPPGTPGPYRVLLGIAKP